MGRATRGGTAEATLRPQITRQEQEQGKGNKGKGHKGDANSWRVNGDGEAEQSGASCDKAKRGIELVRVDWRSQLPRTTYER